MSTPPASLRRPSVARWVIFLAVAVVIYTARVAVEYAMQASLSIDEENYFEHIISVDYFTLSQVWDVLVFWEYAIWITIASFLMVKALRFVVGRPLAELFTR